MGKYVWYVALVVGLSGVAVAAQKVTSPETLDRVMKSAGKASGEVAKSLGASNYAAAKAQLPALRQSVRDTASFWADKKKADGVKFADEVVGKIDALDKALSAPTVDRAAATAAYREVTTSCGGCHRAYRATDEENNFILKPGALN